MTRRSDAQIYRDGFEQIELLRSGHKYDRSKLETVHNKTLLLCRAASAPDNDDLLRPLFLSLDEGLEHFSPGFQNLPGDERLRRRPEILSVEAQVIKEVLDGRNVGERKLEHLALFLHDLWIAFAHFLNEKAPTRRTRKRS